MASVGGRPSGGLWKLLGGATQDVRISLHDTTIATSYEAVFDRLRGSRDEVILTALDNREANIVIDAAGDVTRDEEGGGKMGEGCDEKYAEAETKLCRSTDVIQK